MTYFYRPLLIIFGIMASFFQLVETPIINWINKMNAANSPNTLSIHSEFNLLFWVNYGPITALCFWAAFCLKPGHEKTQKALKQLLNGFAILVLIGALFQFALSVHGNAQFFIYSISTLMFNFACILLLLFAGAITPRQKPEKLSEAFE